MKYNNLSTLSISSRLLRKHLSNCNIARNASTGIRLWDQNLNHSIRHKIEDHWKDKVCQSSTKENIVDDGKEKFYVLSMFPYPSGSLHMGHVRVYAISDAIARFYRMKGKNVIHPMGWDSFGLPAENAARERKIDPEEWTKNNIRNMRDQLNRMGCLFDWDREIATCDPEYYKWTQKIFLMLYERGLAYRREALVNWDPVDCTVLADEQVNADNRSWRSGAKVEKKLLNQWFVRTTAFAESLFDGLDDPSLRDWRDIIKMQKHWIGECTGTNIEFDLIGELPDSPKSLILWTDKPEFLESVKFVAVSRGSYFGKLKDLRIDENSMLLDVKARNPLTGEELPIYLWDTMENFKSRDNYLGIPGICKQDAEFCNYTRIAYENLKLLSEEETRVKRETIMSVAKKRDIGGFYVGPKLRDWLISRQRYWGTPIPIVHCNKCGTLPVPSEELPVLLPKITRNVDDKLTTLREAVDWLTTKCPKCGNKANRELDTMDTFVDSCWYFMRFLDAKNTKTIFDKNKAMKGLPVDVYIGGKEHAVLHLYYARFISHFLHSEGLVPTREPFRQLLVQGMVMGKTYRVKNSGEYLRENETTNIGGKIVETKTGNSVVASWDKMSKSKYNGVDPMEMFNKYGADTTRLIILADVAPTSNRNWSTETFPGIFNWQSRLWLTVRQFIESRKNLTASDLAAKKIDPQFIKDDEYMFDSRNFYLKGVTFNLVRSQQLSVAISKMQGLTNSLRKVTKDCLTHSREYERALATQIIMLAPLAPQFASELWAGFCTASYHLVNDDLNIQIERDVLEQDWPQIDMNYNMALKVYVNGDEISTLKVPRRVLDTMTGDDAARLAIDSNEFQELVEDSLVHGFIFRSEPGCDASIRFRVQMAKKDIKAKIGSKIK